MPKVNLTRARSVPVSKVWASELDFSRWLHEHLDVLGGAMGCDLQSYGREIPVGRFKADLAAEMDGRYLVAIENQLDDSDHSHLGQSLTYAAGLDAQPFIWIAPTFRKEHLVAVERLNIGMAGSLVAFAVQIEVAQIGASEYVPRFEILASPDNFFPHSGERIDYRARRGDGFFQRLVEESGDDQMSGGGNSHREYMAGSPYENWETGISYTLVFMGKDNIAGTSVHLWIETKTRESTLAIFEHLRRQQADIHKEIGHELRWENSGPGLSEACAIRWRTKEGSIDASPMELARTRAGMLDRYRKLRAALDERLPAAIAAASL